MANLPKKTGTTFPNSFVFALEKQTKYLNVQSFFATKRHFGGYSQ